MTLSSVLHLLQHSSHHLIACVSVLDVGQLGVWVAQNGRTGQLVL